MQDLDDMQEDYSALVEVNLDVDGEYFWLEYVNYGEL